MARWLIPDPAGNPFISIDELTKENRILRDEVVPLRSKVMEWENYGTRISQSLKNKEKEINRLQGENSAKDAVLGERDKTIGELQAKIAGLNETLEERDAEIVKLRPWEKYSNDLKDYHQAEIAKLKVELEKKNQDNQAATQTASPVVASVTVNDAKLLELIPHPAIIGVVGKMGSGKTAAAFRIQEISRYRAKPWVFRFPLDKRHLLPDYFGFVDTLEDLQRMPENSILLVDETHLHFSSRRSQKDANITISSIMDLSRHNNLSIIFLMQQSQQVERNIISSITVLVVRELGMYQLKFDRPELRDALKEAKAKLAGLPKTTRQKTAYLFSPDCEFSDLMEMSLPTTFWTEELSRAYGQTTSLVSQGGMHFPAPTSKDELVEQVKRLREQKYTFGKIAKALNIKKTTAHRYAKNTV